MSVCYENLCTQLTTLILMISVQNQPPIIPPQEEGKDNDRLYAVIRDIAEAQNLFVQTLYADIGKNHPLARLLPSEPTHIYPAEANEHSCIIGRWAVCLSVLSYFVKSSNIIRPSLDSCCWFSRYLHVYY